MISKQEALDEEDEDLKPSFVRNKVRKNATSAISHLEWMKWLCIFQNDLKFMDLSSIFQME